ncbi:hypothetical protein D0Y65_041281 [Glycine soja]|uniref:CCHC-type domain-containing protein n=1 Tax=Glycine soja TaxID=3848 RepID=A0A445GVD9_GLYSO|nr:hypothetical protein D0Y65_041281 [Glycine soja]
MVCRNMENWEHMPKCFELGNHDDATLQMVQWGKWLRGRKGSGPVGMYQHETIQDMQKRFTHIVNHLASLGKIFSNEDLISKVLRCLSKQWQPKVTAIAESRDLTNMSLVTLFGKLQEHEMELMRLHQHEESDKKRKEIAFKASSSSIQEESDKEDLNEIEEDDDFRFFVKRFNKFLRNKRNQRKSNINLKKKGEDSSLAPKCYECDQPGHLRFDCHVLKRRMEKSDKRNFKEKKAYITWKDNGMDSSSDSENKIINLGLMAKDYVSGEELTH